MKIYKSVTHKKIVSHLPMCQSTVNFLCYYILYKKLTHMLLYHLNPGVFFTFTYVFLYIFIWYSKIKHLCKLSLPMSICWCPYPTVLGWVGGGGGQLVGALTSHNSSSSGRGSKFWWLIKASSSAVVFTTKSLSSRSKCLL